MNKRLLLVLAVIAVAMVGGATLIGIDSRERPVEKQLFLSDMVGKPAPDFSLKDQKGENFKLSAMRGKKTLLFFNEGIMCYPACWNQMAALGNDVSLNNSEVTSVSIVTDSPAQWTSAFAKMPELYRGMILFDTDKMVSSHWGMLNADSSMHRGSMPGHTYVIIDQNGVVRYVKDDAQMGIRNQEIRDELDKL
ncbi:redoxin family protein [Candidatus Saccharibacteria bacterium]|nr:redoxin family protein [Candidatus Saccharibacteria bacterium]